MDLFQTCYLYVKFIVKLESFLIDNENITEESILELITDNIDLNFNKIIQLCTSGKIKESLFYLDKIYENSSSAINITRLFMKHFKIIEKILLKVENGSNLSETINNSRPPIFFKDRPLLTTQCRLWSLKKINLIFYFKILILIKHRLTGCEGNYPPLAVRPLAQTNQAFN